MSFINESEVEDWALQILEGLGYSILHGPEIAPDGINPLRRSYQDAILEDKLSDALYRINSGIPNTALEEAKKHLLKYESPELIENNDRFHNILLNGITVQFREDGNIKNKIVYPIDFQDINKNEFTAVNQYTLKENEYHRRPDIVIFVNGIPVGVIELKNPGDEEATIKTAFNQLKTYINQIPTLFNTNEILMISDGNEARAGSLTSDWEWFLPWKSIDGKELAPESMPQMEVMLTGIFDKVRLLDIIKNFIVFWRDKESTKKIMAAYHQYHTTNTAVRKSLKATRKDKRCGVVWHTQGSGKSLTMAFYSGKMIGHIAMENPTIVVITDRNDLDDQLFNTFSNSIDLLKQLPTQADDREDLKKKLQVASGGVIFTTVQKFFPENKGSKYPELSNRRNIIVIADEAHRSQYGFIHGFARHIRDALPNASFIGFTGTPIDLNDKSTRSVFGDYIDIYDIEQSVEDGATVKIFYESRLAKLNLNETERPHIDSDFEDVTEGEEEYRKEKLKSKWAKLEALVGSEKRLKLVAEDMVDHIQKREILEGKFMIVCMSRRICVDLYNKISELKPEWVNKDDNKGILKVIMTGAASDPGNWQEHIRTSGKRKEMAKRFKDTKDHFKIVIVRDMWLTGFDAPSLHTLYVDKPMQGHNLMQAIARVNRVFKDKPGGLIVDYIGIADDLRKALFNYTESGGQGKPTYDLEVAVEEMLKRYEQVQDLFYGFDYSNLKNLNPKEKIDLITAGADFVIKQDDGKDRCIKFVTALTKAFALAVPDKRALDIQDEVGFFQAVKAKIVKTTSSKRKTEEEMDTAINQILSKVVITDGIIDIFDKAGLKKPKISILSDEFLEDIKNYKHRNLALETLKRLLNDELKNLKRKNIVQSRNFSEMLEKAMIRYQNRAIETAQVIEELIKLAKKMRESQKRGEELNLREDELAFYDALADNQSARDVLGDKVLMEMGKEIADIIKKHTSIDWTMKESVQAKLRTLVKRTLKRHDYPPDKRKEATRLVLDQARLMSHYWAES